MEQDVLCKRFKPDTIEAMYIDFDSFFASVEQQARPEYIGRPLGVIPVETEHTCCIAASREAKTFGVKTGTMVRDARRLCPKMVFVPARHRFYVEKHHAIMAEIDRHVPLGKVRSIDELVCYLIGSEQKQPEALAKRIKKGLADNLKVGPAITASIGFAPNELLAKIAAEKYKPDNLLIVQPDAIPDLLFDLDLQDVPGISTGIGQRLLRAGVNSLEQLWHLHPKAARRIWGSVEGERYWYALHGYRISRAETQKRMFGHSRVLSSEWRKPEKAEVCLRLLTQKAARRMRREGYGASKLSLGLKTTYGERWGQEVRITPARDDHTFQHLAVQLFWFGLGQFQTTMLKKISVTLHGLVSANEVGPDLFMAQQEWQRRQKWSRISDLLDDLHRKYDNSPPLVLGQSAYQPPGGYAGGKIAFNRIPDLADF